jgi:hypothetical protein
VHLPVSSECTLYVAPEDGCILTSETCRAKKCNKITLNNLHQAGPNKPMYNDAWKHKRKKEKKKLIVVQQNEEIPRIL